MPPDAPVINTAGLVFDRLGLFVAGRFFKGERVMRVRIMRGPPCEGKPIAWRGAYGEWLMARKGWELMADSLWHGTEI